MKIAVMGYGTIGSGVVDVLRINKEKITKRAGEPVDVKYILDLREFPGDPMEDAIVHDYQWTQTCAIIFICIGVYLVEVAESKDKSPDPLKK